MKPTLTRRIFNRIYESIRKKRVLFIGVADYTQKEIRWLIKNNVEVWTFDKDATKSKFGASPNHIIDSIENVYEYFPKNYFDVVFMLGVIGYGLDKPSDILKTFRNLRIILRKDGNLIVSLTKGH
jgi:hypothetical protein